MKIGIIGAGTMGHGIAELCLIHGHDVVLINHKEENLTKAKRKITNSLKKMAEKGKISEEQISISKLKTSVNKKDLALCDIIIEAIIEDLNIKKALFKELDEINRHAIIASNTSTIQITKLQENLSSPERVVGMHFMNPPVMMKLVEVVKGQQTNEETIAQSIDFLKKLEKIPIQVKDTPGFVINRLIIPMINDAAKLAQKEVANLEDIDSIMEIGANHPIGPLKLADMIGIDVVVHILKLLEAQTGNIKFKPCQLLVQKLEQNKLGRKTGEGFYKY